MLPTDGIPLEDAGTWTIQLSVVTATGALTGATQQLRGRSRRRTEWRTTVAPPIVTNVHRSGRLDDDDGATAPPGTTGDTTAGAPSPLIDCGVDACVRSPGNSSKRTGVATSSCS